MSDHGFGEQILLSRWEDLYQWAQNPIRWPLGFGLACCGVEMATAYTAGYELDIECTFPKYPPESADVMIVAGTITFRIAERLKQLHNQMLSPKYVISMGSCANCGGPYWEHGYHVLKGVHQIIPVDIFVPGCPPRFQTFQYVILELSEKIMTKKNQTL